MKRVVVFFPSWRYFGHFALPLFEPLTDNYEIVFFHSEKAVYGWDDCPDLTNKGIDTVDLKHLKTFSFVKALEMLHADCVVVFDKGWVQDRALLHASRHLGIPSLHIQHGIIAPLVEVKTKNMCKRAAVELVKVLKTFRLYNVTMFGLGVGAWIKSFPFQLRLLLNPNHYYYNSRHETVADYACIIGERDKKFFIEKDGYRDDQLIPMGALQFEKAYTMDPRKPQPRLLLISQPLFEDHVLNGGLTAKEKHIREIIEASPLPVAVKPHPRESAEWYREHFTELELFLFPKETDINDAILDCSHVVGYFSTALINALILKRPVGIIRWVDSSAYVLNLDQYGNAVSLSTVPDLDYLIRSTPSEGDLGYYAFNVRVLESLRDSLKLLLKH